MERSDVTFTSDGTLSAGWRYRPDGDGAHPCVVMAHGFAGTRSDGLERYAERFADAGLDVLLFDYRHFGDSGGEPRQLLDIGLQLADWSAAVAYARSLEGVDPDRIALWGSSFSGGHVIVTAARERGIAAVVAQCPFTDGVATLLNQSPAFNLKLTWAALRDELAARRGRPPRYEPVIGPPGSWAALQTPDSEPGYRAIIPPGSRFRNEYTPRLGLRIGRYRPVAEAGRIPCPVLVQVGDRDAVVPPKTGWAAAGAAPRGEIRRYPIGHFDFYASAFESVVADALGFLRTHLLAGDAGSVVGDVAAVGHDR